MRRYLVLFFVFFPVVTKADDGHSETKLAGVRAKMLGKYDSNEDGRLDHKEREQMRKYRKEKAEQSWKKGRGRWQPPEKWIKAYDKDKDGQLSEREITTAFETESAKMQKSYDKNADDKLDDEEKAAIKKDLEERKYEGIDAYIAMRLSGFDRRRGRGRGKRQRSREEVWLDFDTNGDGKASEEELAKIRQHEASRLNAQGSQKNDD